MSWPRFLLGVLVGLALGVLGAGIAAPTVDPTSLGTPEATTTSAPGSLPPSTDALRLYLDGSGVGVGLYRWHRDAAAPTLERRIVADEGAFDPTGAWFAYRHEPFLTRIPALFALDPTGARHTVAVRAKAFAWHEDTPGRLLWVERRTGALIAFGARPGGRPEPIAAVPEADGDITIVGGAWGTALVAGDLGYVYDDEGRFLVRIRGIGAIHGGADGRLAYRPSEDPGTDIWLVDPSALRAPGASLLDRGAPLGWIEPGELPRSIVAEDGRVAVTYLSFSARSIQPSSTVRWGRPGAPPEGELAVEGIALTAWTPDGRLLVGVRPFVVGDPRGQADPRFRLAVVAPDGTVTWRPGVGILLAPPAPDGRSDTAPGTP